MKELDRLLKLKQDLESKTGLSSTENYRKHKIINTIDNLASEYENRNKIRESRSKMEIKDKFISNKVSAFAKDLGRMGANRLISDKDAYKRVSKGVRHVKEVDKALKRNLEKVTPGTQLFYQEQNKKLINKMKNTEKFIKSRKELKDLSNQDIKEIQRLVTTKGYQIGSFSSHENIKDIVINDFEQTFFKGEQAIFKQFRGEPIHYNNEVQYLQNRIDVLGDMIKNDPNYLRNYRKFESIFYEKILIPYYEEMKKMYNKNWKAGVDDMAEILERGIDAYRRIQEGKL